MSDWVNDIKAQEQVAMHALHVRMEWRLLCAQIISIRGLHLWRRTVARVRHDAKRLTEVFHSDELNQIQFEETRDGFVVSNGSFPHVRLSANWTDIGSVFLEITRQEQQFSGEKNISRSEIRFSVFSADLELQMMIDGHRCLTPDSLSERILRTLLSPIYQ